MKHSSSPLHLSFTTSRADQNFQVADFAQMVKSLQTGGIGIGRLLNAAEQQKLHQSDKNTTFLKFCKERFGFQNTQTRQFQIAAAIVDEVLRSLNADGTDHETNQLCEKIWFWGNVKAAIALGNIPKPWWVAVVKKAFESSGTMGPNASQITNTYSYLSKSKHNESVDPRTQIREEVIHTLELLGSKARRSSGKLSATVIFSYADKLIKKTTQRKSKAARVAARKTKELMDKMKAKNSASNNKALNDSLPLDSNAVSMGNESSIGMLPPQQIKVDSQTNADRKSQPTPVKANQAEPNNQTQPKLQPAEPHKNQ